MTSAQLASALEVALAATSRALQALVALAEALETPAAVPAARDEAEEVAAEAEEALKGLDAALAAALTATAVATPGLEARGMYRALEALSNAGVQELQREQKRNRRQRKLLGVLRNVALGLLLLCTPLLAFDAVREALGVTQESHLVPCLATVLLLCQVAMWAADRSGHHLATAVEQQRHRATRYRQLGHAADDVTEATRAASAAQGTLEEVANHLRLLVEAVEQDLTEAQGFPASTRALGTAVVALGTTIQDEEGTRRLARALQALPEEV
ncbi:uncharacterized protein LOC118261238 [Cygnus atratus]|uniref:uncharacterized protein LOC118261238 n=1 Tax=Cygnus atratus TaxID=8868 RepID=UPI0015D629AC|nr:uncharacterized protein LOC118261238 [Cygnus atratus]XP_035427864.1 uncharacterized protein LOC118261238 [Cygnus atratus]